MRFLVGKEDRDPVRRPGELSLGDRRAPVSGELESDFRRGRPALGQRRQQGVRLGGRQPDGFVPVLAGGGPGSTSVSGAGAAGPSAAGANFG